MTRRFSKTLALIIFSFVLVATGLGYLEARESYGLFESAMMAVPTLSIGIAFVLLTWCPKCFDFMERPVRDLFRRK